MFLLKKNLTNLFGADKILSVPTFLKSRLHCGLSEVRVVSGPPAALRLMI